MFVFILAIYLLIFHFDGKWHNFEEIERKQQKQNNNKIILMDKGKGANGGVNAWTMPKEGESEYFGIILIFFPFI
jgi:hypothetical protein